MTGFVGTLTDYALMDEGEFIGKYAARIDDKPYVVMPHVVAFLMRLQKGARVDVVLNKDGWISKISPSKNPAPADDLATKMQKNGFAVPAPATQPKEVPPERAPDELFTDAEVAAMKAKPAAHAEKAPVVDGIAAIVAATKANADRLRGEQKQCTSSILPAEPCQSVSPVRMSKPVLIAKSYSNDEMLLLRNVIAKGCNEPEFKLLMYMANTYGLDPLLKQIWAVKRNENTPALIFAGRDGMLAIAHRSGQFDGMQSGVVYEGEGKDRKPVTAWCEVWRKDMAHSFKTDVPFSEYNTGFTVWKTNPSAMILKVAESVCLRKAFSVSGLYCPEEISERA